jgi:hypothetical protein
VDELPPSLMLDADENGGRETDDGDGDGGFDPALPLADDPGGSVKKN